MASGSPGAAPALPGYGGGRAGPQRHPHSWAGTCLSRRGRDSGSVSRPGVASPRGAGRCQPGVRPVRARGLSLAAAEGPRRGGGEPGLVLCLLLCQASPLPAGREAWRPGRARRATVRLLAPAYSIGVGSRFPSVRNKIG